MKPKVQTLLILQAASYFGAFAACEIARAVVWKSTAGLAQRAALAGGLGAVMLSATAALAILPRRPPRAATDYRPRSKPIPPRIPRPLTGSPECAGMVAVATCPVCAGRTHSTVLDEWEQGAQTIELFCCQHCHALIVSVDAIEDRQPWPDELRRFRGRWPIIWADMEAQQAQWRAKFLTTDN
jgi:hypothetical protein